ncbi:aldose epimerase family protein [Paracoccus aminophilus]|uniref:Aldose 1-epimerase n=1 Tax=Paracoccus aminophilus JCM 7686 TaxID=1367847 RepID=S5XSB3_PARAH|nr:aldose epimerase family protein [Paracoccus aminophilus]AGT10344.1 aldose 1-epimerase [Paracoccus aminophilus JCM 7686]
MTAFGVLPDGQPVEQITISGHGLTASVLTFGARLQDLRLKGIRHPLVLGFPDLEPYFEEGLYFGAIVGRFANRIGEGRARIGETEYQLDRNFLGKHLLHGGSAGTAARNWRIHAVSDDSVTLSDRLPQGDMGFPGNLDIRVTYTVVAGPSLQITIAAMSDAETLCNFAQHSYFNLDGTADVTGHYLQILAPDYTPVDAELIPTGAVAPLAGTAFDFWHPRLLDEVDVLAELDHNFCIASARLPQPVPAARLSAGVLTMEITSTEPGIQAYAGAYQRPGAPGLAGLPYGPNAGIALESQLWPDAPNHPHFPDALLRPGETYLQETCLTFSRRDL